MSISRIMIAYKKIYVWILLTILSILLPLWHCESAEEMAPEDWAMKFGPQFYSFERSDFYYDKETSSPVEGIGGKWATWRFIRIKQDQGGSNDILDRIIKYYRMGGWREVPFSNGAYGLCKGVTINERDRVFVHEPVGKGDNAISYRVVVSVTDGNNRITLYCIQKILNGIRILAFILNSCPKNRFSGGFDDRCPSIRAVWLAPLILVVGR